MPISTSLVVVGISKLRESKKLYAKAHKSHARLLLVDIFNRELIWDINLSELGLDAVFSILPSDHQHASEEKAEKIDVS